MAETLNKRRGYAAEDFAPFIGAKGPIPNFKYESTDHVIRIIASCGGYAAPSGPVLLMIPESRSGHYGRVFLHQTQGGAYDGTGLMIWCDGPDATFAARFAICEHKFVPGPGGNPRRGYNPGACGKCGLDMTVNSGD